MMMERNVDSGRIIPSLRFDVEDKSIPSLEESRRYISNIDFSMMIHKITLPDPNIARIWDKEAALQVVRYYKNYLWLLRKYSEQHPIIPPSIDVDEIWHHHILDTYKYHNDCSAIFGQYLHHYPYFGMRGEQDYADLQETFKITQALHFKEFGEYIYSFETEDVE